MSTSTITQFLLRQKMSRFNYLGYFIRVALGKSRRSVSEYSSKKIQEFIFLIVY